MLQFSIYQRNPMSSYTLNHIQLMHGNHLSTDYFVVTVAGVADTSMGPPSPQEAQHLMGHSALYTNDQEASRRETAMSDLST